MLEQRRYGAFAVLTVYAVCGAARSDHIGGAVHSALIARLFAGGEAHFAAGFVDGHDAGLHI